MASWRDSASGAAQDDLDGLLDPALGHAREQLARSGGFVPLAFTVDHSGVIAGLALAEQYEYAAEVVDAYRALLREQRDTFRAAALVMDALVGSEDVVQVEMEHADGQALVVMLPYTRRRPRRITFGDLRAAPGRHRIWA